jgi:phage-related protein
MNTKIAKKLEVIFYHTESGTEPVREWLRELSKADKKLIGDDIKTVQFGWPIGMPLVDYLGTGLWEIRTKLTGRKIARIIFFLDNHTLVLVNGFIKKTQKTPQQELELAQKRKRQYELNS